VHVIRAGKKRAGQTRAQDESMGVYSEGRYFTFSGRVLPGAPCRVVPAQAALDEYYAAKFPEVPPAPAPVAPVLPLAKLNKHHVYERVCKSKQARKFASLMAGDTAGYPSASEALWALIGILKFYTRDAGIIREIVERSRIPASKWGERRAGADYLDYNIARALQ
jgi:primase-polymerase (primpol)-like protein